MIDGLVVFLFCLFCVFCALLILLGGLIATYVRILRADARRDAEDFRRKFPGRCMICSYRRYGIDYGHVEPGTTPERHHRIEGHTE